MDITCSAADPTCLLFLWAGFLLNVYALWLCTLCFSIPKVPGLLEAQPNLTLNCTAGKWHWCWPGSTLKCCQPREPVCFLYCAGVVWGGLYLVTVILYEITPHGSTNICFTGYEQIIFHILITSSYKWNGTEFFRRKSYLMRNIHTQCNSVWCTM